MSEFHLIKSLTSYSWPFSDIHLMGHLIFKIFINDTHISVWLSEFGGAPHFCLARALSHLSRALNIVVNFDSIII
jgi:hypothetical protein